MEGDAAAALAAFDALRRGDPAPPWVREGIVDAWALPADTDVRFLVLSENATFRAGAGTDAIVVRLSRPGYGGGARHLRSELAWVDALRAEGIPTSRVVAGADGEQVQRLRDAAGAGWLAVATAFVPGVVLEEQPGFERHATELGRLTALLHLQAARWRRPTWFERFDWELGDLVGASARWGDWRAARLAERERELLERAERSAKAALAEAGGLGREPDRFGLIHADLRPSNAIAAADGALTIIDFDDAGFGRFGYDFAASLTFYEHREIAYQLAAGWIEGYRGVAPLERPQLDEAAAWSMIRRLTMLGWCQTHREDALPPDLWAQYLPGTLDVAARYLERPGWILP